MAVLSILPATNLNWIDIRDTLALGAENDGRDMMISANVNPWGFNPPDAAQFDRYFGKTARFQPHDMGTFRLYEHRRRSYTYGQVQGYRHVSNQLIGITLTTAIANEAISDDPGTIASATIRATFQVLSQYGTWTTAGYITGTVNKVGTINLYKSITSLYGYLSARVRIWLSSDTPLTDRIFDPRHLPSTIIEGDGTVDTEYDGGYFTVIGTAYDNAYWEIDYNFFENKLYWSAPAGAVQDGNGFWDMQVKNYARWASTVDIEVYGIETQNWSPWDDGLVLLMDVSADINFATYDTYTAITTPTPISRGWASSGNNTHGEDSDRIVFSNVGSYGATTFCRLRMGLDMGHPIDYYDNNLFGITFKMI